jgi:hypothetical protein
MTEMYARRQIGTQMLLVLAIVWVGVGLPLWYVGLLGVFAGITLLFGVCAVIFSSMTIRIVGPNLEWSLGFGLFAKRFPLSDIASVDAVTLGPLAGLGARTNNFRDWLWIVSGSNAVTFRFVNGRTLSLGTDDPDNLIAAVNR